ncbi:MAG: efflux RND transporter permease subunit, partial [Candidatus Binatia bacterium]
VRERQSRVSRAIERSLEGATATYGRALDWGLAHRPAVGIFFVVTLLLAVVLFYAIPQGFVPVEDKGRIMTLIRAPQGSTGVYTDHAMRKVEEAYASLPEYAGMFAAIGMGFGEPPNTASGGVFTRLHPWRERTRTQQEIVAMLQQQFFAIPQALVFPVNPPSLGQMSISDVEVILRSPSAERGDFAAVIGRILGRLREAPGLVNVDTDLRLENPEVDVAFDRERAADLGVPIQAVAESLRLLVSQSPADEFVLRNRQYDVITALAGTRRSVPDDLTKIHVRAGNGRMIPLSALIEPRPGIGATTLNHHDLERSATINGNLGPGAALGPVLDRVLEVVREEIPQGFTTAFGGISREYLESTAQVYLTFAIALLVIFLVLAAQFESFVHPLTILFSVPLASLGALLTLWATGQTNNLYTQIGMILLIGLVTKNSILLVDFANQERARGTALLEALRGAGRTRFRPILMTSMTSVLGAMPLALAFGAGAESRRAIGAAVVGGLFFSTAFTLVVIPVVHFALVRLAERAGINTVPPLVELGSEKPGR